MELMLDEVVAILSRSPATLDALLSGLPETLLATRPADDAFSPIDVLGHLIHGEKTDWVPRIKVVLASGSERPFEPFDRVGFKAAIAGRSVSDLLVEFGALRVSNLAYLRSLSLTPSHLSLPGRHPELGLVTLGQLLATWAVHDLNHIGQVARVVSLRYAAAVGPWKPYLGILSQ